MADERPVVNVTPGKIRSQAEIDADTVRVNTGSVGEKLPPLKITEADREARAESLLDDEFPELKDPRGPRFRNVEMSDEEARAREQIEEFMKLPLEQRLARHAVVLDRGVVYDRLKVDLPDDLYGEWPRNDPLEIDRMRTLGFWVDNTYATRRSLHSDGSSANIVADVIHMVTTRQNKEMIDRVYLEKQIRSARHPKHAIEDDEFVNKMRETGQDVPAFSESKQHEVRIDDVRAAIQRANAQTQPRT